MLRILIVPVLAMRLVCFAFAADREGFVTYRRLAVLTSQRPTNEFLRVKLISIDTNGSTRIQVLSSGEIIEAPVGGHFSGTNGFGKLGVRLASASREKSEARLQYLWCEGTK